MLGRVGISAAPMRRSARKINHPALSDIAMTSRGSQPRVMSSFSRAVAFVFAAGMVVGAGLLIVVPAGTDLGVAAIYVPDPPAVPCKRQTWPNTDRGCLPWTVPQGE